MVEGGRSREKTVFASLQLASLHDIDKKSFTNLFQIENKDFLTYKESKFGDMKSYNNRIKELIRILSLRKTDDGWKAILDDNTKYTAHQTFKEIYFGKLKVCIYTIMKNIHEGSEANIDY